MELNMTDEDLQNSTVLVSQGDSASKDYISMASGSRLYGRKEKFPDVLIPENTPKWVAKIALVPPAPADEHASMPGGEYAYDSAGGVEFPRERLGPEFFEDVNRRYEENLDENGEPTAFSLLAEPPEQDPAQNTERKQSA
jgi:hypothetical protein